MTWKMRGRIAGISILCLAFVSANAGIGGAGNAASRSGSAPDSEFGMHRPQINLAHIQARKHLDRFFDAVIGSDGVARNGAAIRVALPVENGRREKVWVTPFARRDGVFYGTLADTPQGTSGQARGYLVTFQRADIRDWSFYGIDGRLYGNFTTRLLLNALPATQAAEISALLSVSPAPLDW